MKCILCHKTKLKLIEKNLFDDRYGCKGKFSVYKCLECAVVQTIPRLSSSEIPLLYNKYYPLKKITASDVKRSVKKQDSLVSWMYGTNNIAHHYVSLGANVLDIGSGTGASLLEIKQLGANGFGVEPDPQAQKLASSLIVKVYKGEITDNPFPNQKFDFVTASQVIEHVPDPLSFIKHSKKKLNLGGRIILSTPNFDSLSRKIYGRSWIHWHIPYHQNYFSKNSIQELADLSNLKLVKIKTITPNLWTLLQLRMLVTNPIEGEPSSVWKVNSGSSTKTNKNKFSLVKTILFIVNLLIFPINRLIDVLGMGDSLLIFMEQKK